MTISSNLASGARRALRAAAHHLDPVVMIGEKGLSASVLHEIDIALTAHALIKVRVASDDREQRIAFMQEICEKMSCESVQHLGKLLVLWRNKEDGAPLIENDEDGIESAPAARARGPRSKLASAANEKDAGFRRPSESEPRPREGRSYGDRSGGGGYGKPAGSGYGKPAGGGYGKPAGAYDRSASSGESRGYGRSADRGEGYAARGGYSRDEAARPPRPSGGFTKPEGRFTGEAGNRRFRRSDDAPPQDTRPPREGWAPRDRRGAGRAGGRGDGRNDAFGSAGTSSGFSRGRDASSGGDTGSQGFQDRGDRRAPPKGRSYSGESRWGSRGGSANSGAAGAGAPKPRARRRLG